jgi:hypothetical protein
MNSNVLYPQLFFLRKGSAMVYNALQKLFIGVAVLSFAAISPAAATGNVSVLADFENATNENYYGQYIFLYDDHKDKGNSKITNQALNAADSTYNFLPTKDAGNTVAGGTPGYGAEVDFTLGSINPSNATATWGSMIGIGAMLAAEGSYMDLTGAQKIEFYAKVERPKGTTTASVDLRVEVCTEELAADYGYYHIIIPITGTWAKYTIPLDTVNVGFGKLEQWDWSITNGGKKPFNIKKVSKIQWCLSEDGNVTSWKDASGALFLDDISISPFTPHFFDEIEANKLTAPGATGLLPTNMLSNFDINMKNSLGYYGYCYTDVDANPTAANASVITAGAVPDSTGKFILGVSDGGVGGTSCASIGFQLGKTFVQGANTVQPFVGIGTNLVPEIGGAPAGVCDISAATAVYFDYKLQCAGVQFLSFELRTDQSFGNSGAVYYVKLPNTNGEWKGATVDLSAAAAELVLPKWADVTPSPLDKTKALKLQWKAQGAANSEGTLAIDNIYIPGYTMKVIRFGNKPALKSAFTVKQLSNLAQVSFALPQSVSNARVDLVSMQGKVLASQSVKRNNGSEYQVAFPTSRLANGSYFVKVNYDNKDVKSSMISIIR